MESERRADFTALIQRYLARREMTVVPVGEGRNRVVCVQTGCHFATLNEEGRYLTPAEARALGPIGAGVN